MHGLFLAALFLFQDNPPVGELIEKLRSEAVEERDNAFRALKGLGKAALPVLERAASDKDPEVAGRARVLLRRIELLGTLTPDFQKAFPHAVDRLAEGTPHDWTEHLLQATSSRNPAPVRRTDLEPLAARALRGANGFSEMYDVRGSVIRRRLRSALPEAVRLLGDSNDDRRRIGVELLQGLWARDRSDEIAALLDAPEAGVRASAARLLGTFRARDQAPALAKRLGDPDPGVRLAAAEALSLMDVPEAIPCLIELLDVAAVRHRAGLALGSAGRKEAIPVLLEALKESVEPAAGLLAKLKAKEALPSLLKRLRDPREYDRQQSAIALAAIGIEGHVDEVVSLLKHEDMTVRWWATRALRGAPQTQALPIALKLLRDPALNVVFEAAELLAAQPATVLPEIRRMLAEQDVEVRSTAVLVLGYLPAKDAVPILVDCLEHKDLRDTAVRVLLGFQSVHAIPWLIRMLREGEADEKGYAAWMIGNLRVSEAIPDLLPLVKTDQRGARQYALSALGLLEARDHGALLMPSLTHPDKYDRRRAARALGLMNHRDATAPLSRLLDDPEPLCQTAAIEALARMGAREFLPRFVEFLDHDDADLREFSAAAIAALEPREAADLLLPLLQDPQPFVRYAAASSLCSLGKREGTATLLEDRRPLSSLNALRAPELWDRLRRERFTMDPRATREEAISQIGRDLGLQVEWGTTSVKWRSSFVLDGTSADEPVRTRLDALRLSCHQLRHFSNVPEFVLEPDRLCILSATEGAEFWRAWSTGKR